MAKTTLMTATTAKTIFCFVLFLTKCFEERKKMVELASLIFYPYSDLYSHLSYCNNFVKKLELYRTFNTFRKINQHDILAFFT